MALKDKKGWITVYIEAESGKGALPIEMPTESLIKLGAKSGDELVWLVENGKTIVKKRVKTKKLRPGGVCGSS